MTKPVAKLRDGRLTATIWENETTDRDSGEIGSFYSVEITRSFKDKNDQWQSAASYSGADLLKVANLATAAYNHLLTLRQAE